MRGFSILEVLLAVAVFAIISVSVSVAVVSSLNVNRLSSDMVTATQYASEGIEAAKSIKNMDFATFGTPSAAIGVVRTAANTWAWAGTGNSFDSGRYTRQITVSTISATLRKVVSTVTWQFIPGQNKSVDQTAYFTNWESSFANYDGGIIIYSDGTTTPKYRTYDATANTFSTEQNVVTGTAGRNFSLKTSPTKHEVIAGYTDATGILQIMCFDGSTWTNEWTATVGGTGTTKRFDIAYETNSGDAIVVYSTNTGTTNELAYRTKLGSDDCGSANWSSATNLDPVRTSGIVHWVRLEGDPRSSSNNIALAWADANQDLSAMIWTGGSFAIVEPTAALETNLEIASAAQDVQSFDLAVESQTGNVMIVWGLSQATTCTAGTTIATTNCIRYARYTSSWSAVAVIPTVADPATNIDISSNPLTNEMVVASLDNNQGDLSCAYWSGSAWTGKANQDTSTALAAAGTKLVATGWLTSGATTRSIVVYNDSATTNIGWVVGSGGTFTTQTDFTPTPAFANPQKWYRIDQDPTNKDRLIFSLSDNSSRLFAKRLIMTAVPGFTWTNADGGAAIETTLGQSTSHPFGFSYWRFQ